MKLKPVVLAVVAAGLVGPAFAAYGGHNQRTHSSACSMPSVGMTHAQELMNGNSIYSSHKSRKCWQNRVAFSGFGDFLYAHAKSDVTVKGLELSDAVLMMDAKINSKWSAHLAGGYTWIGDDAAGSALANLGTGVALTTFDTAKSFHLQEAFVTYSDQGRTPMYFKVGKGFVNFGHYSNPYAIFPTITQAFSQLNENNIELGVVSSQGWHVAATGWTDNATAAANEHQYAVKVGFDQQKVASGVGVSGSLSYISNMDTVLDKSPFYLAGYSTTANNKAYLVDLNASLPSNFTAGASYLATSKDRATAGTKESVWGLNLGYKVKAGGYAHTFAVNYEDGHESAWKHRWSLDYAVGVASNIDAYAQYAKYDNDAAANDIKGWLIGLRGSF